MIVRNKLPDNLHYILINFHTSNKLHSDILRCMVKLENILDFMFSKFYNNYYVGVFQHDDSEIYLYFKLILNKSSQSISYLMGCNIHKMYVSELPRGM